MDLSVKFLGIKLKNPIIIASCPICEDYERIIQAYKDGAAAIILKTCTSDERFIDSTARRCYMDDRGFWLTSSFSTEIMDINDALDLFSATTKNTDIPIIPSVTTQSLDWKEWLNLCKLFENKGAKFIQLDFFYIKNISYKEYEHYITDILCNLGKETKLVLFPKINFNMHKEIIFNAFKKGSIQYISLLDSIKMPPPFDFYLKKPLIQNIENCSSSSLYGSWQYPITLNYTFDFAKKNYKICSGGGIDNAYKILELLYYGASAVQIATYFLINGTDKIREILLELEKILTNLGYHSLNDFIKNRFSFKKLEKKSLPVFAMINEKKCVKCQKCVKQAFCTAIEYSDNSVKIIKNKCSGCSFCKFICKFDAIEILNQ